MTLRKKLLIPTLLTVFLGFALFVMYQVSSQKKEIAVTMQKEMDHLSDLVAKANVSYLWNYDTIGLQLSIDSMLKDTQITGIEIFDISDNSMSKAEEETLQNSFEKDIVLERDGSPVGRARIVFTDYHIREQSSAFIKRIIILEVILFLMVALIITFLAQIVTKPIIRLSGIMKGMAEGEADLTERIPMKGNDEVSTLSRHFNIFLDKLRLIVLTLKSVGIKSQELGNELEGKAKTVSSSSSQLSVSMKTMNDRIGLLVLEVEKSSESVERINGYINRVVDMIQDQAAAVNESSASVEQMIANVGNIDAATGKKLELVNNLKAQAKKLDSGMNLNVKMMEETSKSSELISDMVAVINNIASQTNLLAMNAAIEASHAGQYGKGFSVVANEIRKLAELTASNAKSIGETIKTVVTGIKNATVTTQGSSATIKEVIIGIESVSDGMNETLSGLKEISIGNSQIIESLTSLNTITETVKTSGSGMSEGTKEINDSIKKITATTGENKRGIEDMTGRIQAISDSMASLSDLSVRNAENIKTLEDQIKKFKA